MQKFSRIYFIVLALSWLAFSSAHAVAGCTKPVYRADNSVTYKPVRCQGQQNNLKKKKVAVRRKIKKRKKRQKKVKRVTRQKDRTVQKKKKKYLASARKSVPRKASAILVGKKKSGKKEKLSRKARKTLVKKIKKLQQLLSSAGYSMKKIDGILGRKTWAAVVSYARKSGIENKAGQIRMMTIVLQHLEKNKDKPGKDKARIVRSAPKPFPSRKKLEKPEFDRADVRTLQEGLVRAGYETDRTDGLMGKDTLGAMRKYYLEQGVRRRSRPIFVAVLAHIKDRQPGTGEVARQTGVSVGSSVSLSGKMKKRVPVDGDTVRPVVFTGDTMPSAERGEKLVEEQCRGCHSFSQTGRHKVGPKLYGVTGRLIGSEDFGYSQSLKFQMSQGMVWNHQELDCFLKDPEGCKPGTSMGFEGIKSREKRADIIAWLERLKQ